VYLRPGTRGRVGSFVGLVGEVFAKIRRRFAVQTEFVKAGAEGTAFSMQGSPAGTTRWMVFDGSVRLSSLAAAWPPLALGPGAMSAGRPRRRSACDGGAPDELARTRGWVERIEQLVPAPTRASKRGRGPCGGRARGVSLRPAPRTTNTLARADRPGRGRGAVGRGGARSCRRLALRWSPVGGAHGLCRAPGRRAPDPPNAWRLVGTITEAAPPLPLSERLRAGWSYRWKVQARDSRGEAAPCPQP
jgi:hypothetical protein